MALSPSKLKSKLEKVFSTPQDKIQPAARDLAAAYASYAQDGKAGTASIVGIAAAQKTLEGAIAAAYASGGPMPATVAKIGTALVAFWVPLTAAPPVPGASGPGVILTPPVPPTPALMALMGTQLSLASSGVTVSAKQNAAGWATALDLFTKTVIFTFPPVSGSPIPLPVT